MGGGNIISFDCTALPLAERDDEAANKSIKLIFDVKGNLALRSA